jgi:hypothetical protein
MTALPDNTAESREILDDGGPAYPCMTDSVLVDVKADRVVPIYQGGMSLRVYLAGQALVGLCASKYIAEAGDLDDDEIARFRAIAAFEHADAVIGHMRADAAIAKAATP